MPGDGSIYSILFKGNKWLGILLGQWLNGLNFLGLHNIFSRENKPFKLFFQGPLAK